MAKWRQEEDPEKRTLEITASITWDSAWPVESSVQTKFHLILPLF